MGKAILLGTAAFIPSEGADNTHLLIQAGSRVVLIDTAANPYLSLRKVGMEPNFITDLVLTHFHPDHVSGLPLLMMGMWVTGRKNDLHVYGLDYTLERARKMLDLFNISTWAGCYPIHYHSIPGTGLDLLFEDEQLRLLGSEVKHLIPTMGLRAEFPGSGKALAYSCDSEPCEAIEQLARNADVLLHESAGNSKGHSSAFQAGQTAARADVKSLYLVHYPGNMDAESLVRDARSAFQGEVIAARDFMTIPMD